MACNIVHAITYILTMGDKMVKLGLALAMVVVGGLAIWYVFGGVIINALTTLLTVL